jgi:hypothetical protein
LQHIHTIIQPPRISNSQIAGLDDVEANFPAVMLLDGEVPWKIHENP